MRSSWREVVEVFTAGILVLWNSVGLLALIAGPSIRLWPSTCTSTYEAYLLVAGIITIYDLVNYALHYGARRQDTMLLFRSDMWAMVFLPGFIVEDAITTAVKAIAAIGS
jgi:hypothetical protein